jgi:hypothetical protein
VEKGIARPVQQGRGRQDHGAAHQLPHSPGRQALAQEQGRQQAHQGGIEVQQQGHQPGRGVLQGGEEAQGLAHIADAAHAAGHRQFPPARPLPARGEHDRHQHHSAARKKRGSSTPPVLAPAA